MSLSPAFVAPPASIDADAYRLIFEQSPQPMWLFDEQTLAFVEVNEAAVSTYGYSRDEFLRMDITQIRPPAEIPAVLQRIRSGATGPPRTWKHVTKGGRTIDVEVASTPLLVGGRTLRVTVIRDVSGRTQMEAQLRQAQKMEAIGQLAGGLAHDFNALVTSLVRHTERLSEYFTPADPRAIEVAGIRRVVQRAASLTKQLLACSRTQILQPMVLDVNDLIDRNRGILGRLMGEPIELAIDLEPALRSVKADRGQIEQMLWNLAVNARDAMPDGGRLTLRTRNALVGRAQARRLGLEAGDYVEVSVADTGLAIDAAIQAHLFEPFFTTKERGRGTGLGLTTVHAIVKQSGGQIVVESEPGRGTTFVIHLPATVPTDASADVPEPPADGGRETILLVEDDSAVRGLIGDVLRRRGYRLLEADSAPRAIELVSAHLGAIDLLITDVAMPGTTGPAVADAMRATHGDVKVLYVSGYTDDVMMPGGFTEATGAFLHKPFTPDALARKVRAVLST